MFRLTNILRPAGTYSRRLFSTGVKPVEESVKKQVSNPALETAGNVLLTGSIIVITGSIYYAFDGKERYQNYVSNQQSIKRRKEWDDERLVEQKELKLLVEVLSPINKKNLTNYADRQKTGFTQVLKEDLYAVDVEGLAVKSAIHFKKNFKINRPTKHDPIGLTHLEKCNIFKDLSPDYKKHLKENKQMDLNMEYKLGENSWDGCWYEFTY